MNYTGRQFEHTGKWKHTYLLLLHEFGVGAVVHHISPENRGRQNGIYLLRIHIAKLAIEDEIVTGGS